MGKWKPLIKKKNTISFHQYMNASWDHISEAGHSVNVFPIRYNGLCVRVHSGINSGWAMLMSKCNHHWVGSILPIMAWRDLHNSCVGPFPWHKFGCVSHSIETTVYCLILFSSQQNFAHTKTAVLSWYVKIFVMIRSVFLNLLWWQFPVNLEFDWNIAGEMGTGTVTWPIEDWTGIW